MIGKAHDPLLWLCLICGVADCADVERVYGRSAIGEVKEAHHCVMDFVDGFVDGASTRYNDSAAVYHAIVDDKAVP
jgi:hypothetical protein